MPGFAFHVLPIFCFTKVGVINSDYEAGIHKNNALEINNFHFKGHYTE